jgi:tetratricopeptide (TPR) repeat protein
VPFENNPRFTGREDELVKLEEMLSTEDYTARTAITGLGGVGKTQLALQLLFRIKEKHSDCSIIWIAAMNRESLHQAYLTVAQKLGISALKDTQADVKRLVQAHLSQESIGPWLLVFDNADDIGMWISKPEPRLDAEQEAQPLIDYLPKHKHGAILFTTRDKKMAVKLAQQNVVELEPMPQDTATDLLEKCLINSDLVKDQQDTRSLVSELTYLPLAIVQAAAYINENTISIGQYLSLLAEQEEDVIELLSEEFEDHGRYRNVKNPVATTWLISFERIQQHNDLAAKYLIFMACIFPKDIPQSLLPAGPSRKKEVDAIGALVAYSFVSRRPNKCFDLHRLVHLAMRNWLRKGGKFAQSEKRAVSRLEAVFPDWKHENRTLWRQYLTHASYVLGSNSTKKDDEARTSLMQRVAGCLDVDGRWKEAGELAAQVMETSVRVLGEEHPVTLASIGNLASAYRNQGRWKEAEELEVRVIETMLRVAGVEHPYTLTGMNNLTSTYSKQGRWREAEELGARVMEIKVRVLGEEHPSALISMGNLAVTYSDQGRWREAEELEVRVIETSKRVLGEEHPNTLASIANLASTYSRQGRCREAEAEELGARVMEMKVRVLGEEHPSTLTSMNNLARTWWSCGRQLRAVELMTKCQRLLVKVQGDSHPHTVACSSTLQSWTAA